ncbi:MAG: DUF6141 family protein [Euryarchaeota archaeon]|nr:DUF6141 family protein [Euryarchaeota archaeon]
MFIGTCICSGYVNKGEVTAKHLEKGLIFREVQKLQNTVFLASVLYPALLLWYIEIYSLAFGKPAGVQNLPDFCLLALWFIFGVLLPLLSFCTKNITEVRKDGIYIRLVPLNPLFKKIPIYVIEECKIQAYEPFTAKDSMDKTPSKRENFVVTLKLITGKRVVINSKNPKELQQAIMSAVANF